MKKTKLILALAISAMVINSAYASEEIENTNDGRNSNGSGKNFWNLSY